MSPYQPETHGNLERFRMVMKDMLKAMTGNNSEN